MRFRRRQQWRLPSPRSQPSLETVTEPRGQFECLHFSLTNAREDRPSDLPHLLRRIADEIDARAIKPIEILDLTISQEITEDGPWWSVTLYWSPGGDE
jgi:hypothetical protein